MLRMLKLLQVFSRVLDFVTTDDKPVRKILEAKASHRPVTGQSSASRRPVRFIFTILKAGFTRRCSHFQRRDEMR